MISTNHYLVHLHIFRVVSKSKQNITTLCWFVVLLSVHCTQDITQFINSLYRGWIWWRQITNTINRIVTGLEKLEVIIILSQGCEDWLPLLQEWDHLIQVPALTWPSHRPPWYRSHVTCHMSHVQLPTCVQTRSISKPPRWSPGTATWPSQHIALPWYGTTLMYCYVFFTFIYSSSISASIVEGLANSVSQIFLPYLSNNGS